MTKWRLKPGESVRDTVRRVARHELDRMIGLLRGRARAADAVHEARKCGKRLRSLLRLVREPLGKRTFARENGALRDVVGALGPVRDAEALVDVVGKPTRTGPRALQHLRRELRLHLDRVVRTTHIGAVMRRAARDLESVQSRAPKWSPHGHGWRALAPGLETVYRRARSAAQLNADPPIEALHEWRKRAKNLQHALELLEPLWPAAVHSLAKTADSLCDRLGDDRDLARLEALAIAEPETFGPPTGRKTVLTRIAARRRKLLADARELGAHLFAEDPTAFVRRLRSYWSTWRRP